MKRGRKRTRKLKPHETLDGLKGLATEAAARRGHCLGWLHVNTLEAHALCTRCGGLAVIVIRLAGVENVITGSAINSECPNRQQGAIL